MKNTDSQLPVDGFADSTASRRQLIGAAAVALGAGLAGVAAGQQPTAGDRVAPATRPSIGPDGQPLAPEYVDEMTPGMRGEGQLVKGYAAPLAKTDLKPITIKRREPGGEDVELDILYCGICHSDIHMVHNDWKNAIYPCMPGHEFVGRVTRVGAQVKRFKAGDIIAVGPVIDSCGHCKPCQEKLEQYCEGPKGRTEAYNGPAKADGTNTYGGYSKRFVVREHFAYNVPTNLDVKGVAPLLCAGMTVYSPLMHWKAGPGVKVGVVGMGGLGHLAVKLAAAMGAEVTVFSMTPEKQADAMKFGAKQFVLSNDFAAMKQMELTQDLIISTIPYPYDPNHYIKTLAKDGKLVTVGLLFPFSIAPDGTELCMHRRSLASSLIGGTGEYGPYLEFCGKHNITATVEVIRMEDVNDAYPKVMGAKVRYRYVIDMAQSMKHA